MAIYALDDTKLIGAFPFPEGDVFALTFSLNGGLLLAAGGKAGVLQGGAPGTTNHRMGMMARGVVVETRGRPSTLTVVTDST